MPVLCSNSMTRACVNGMVLRCRKRRPRSRAYFLSSQSCVWYLKTPTYTMHSLRGSSVNIGTIQTTLACPLRKEDSNSHNSCGPAISQRLSRSSATGRSRHLSEQRYFDILDLFWCFYSVFFFLCRFCIFLMIPFAKDIATQHLSRRSGRWREARRHPFTVSRRPKYWP